MAMQPRGLMQDDPNAQGPPAGGQGDPADNGQFVDDGEQPNVSPEEQAEYDQFVSNAQTLVYGPDDKGNDQLLKALGASEDWVGNLAQAALTIVIALEQNAAKSGHQITDDVLFHGGMEIVEMLADVASNAGIHDYQEKEVEGAAYRAVDMYREINPTGRIDPDDLKQQFGQMVDADRAGQLTQLLPQLSGMLDQAAGQQGAPPPQEQRGLAQRGA